MFLQKNDTIKLVRMIAISIGEGLQCGLCDF